MSQKTLEVLLFIYDSYYFQSYKFGKLKNPFAVFKLRNYTLQLLTYQCNYCNCKKIY